MSAAPPEVLVIDDSPLIQRLVKSALTQAGYVVRVASGVDEAIADINSTGSPALLLVDVKMPGMQGDDLVRWLRDRMQISAPILLFSDIKEDELTHRARESGATGHVSKHRSLRHLVEVVNRELGHTPLAAAAARPADETAIELPSASQSGTSSIPRRDVTTRRISGRQQTAPPAAASDEAIAVPSDDASGNQTSGMQSTRSTSSAELPIVAKRQVLLVDDSPMVLQLVKRSLTRAGYRVITVDSFVKIESELLVMGDPDLILVDINMPDVQGDDLVVYLRDNLDVSAPIVLFSGLPEHELEYLCREVGADGWICKNWGVDKLVDHVRTYAP